jgi:hypothetical protein
MELKDSVQIADAPLSLVNMAIRKTRVQKGLSKQYGYLH